LLLVKEGNWTKWHRMNPDNPAQLLCGKAVDTDKAIYREACQTDESNRCAKCERKYSELLKEIA